MRIPKIQKKNPPLGFLNVVDVINELGVGKFGEQWLKQPYVKALPFRIGPVNENRTKRELLQLGWDPNGDKYDKYEWSWPLPRGEFAEARAVRKQFLELTESLRSAVQSRQVAIRFQSFDGERPLSKAPPGIIESQWNPIVETGQIRVRQNGQPDQLWTIFFEKKKVVQLAKGKVLRSSKDIAMTDEACIARAKEIMIDAKDRAARSGVILDRENYETVVSRALLMERGAMTDDLFETCIWKTDWREQQGIKILQGRQATFRKAKADAFIESILTEYRKAHHKKRPTK